MDPGRCRAGTAARTRGLIARAARRHRLANGGHEVRTIPRMTSSPERGAFVACLSFMFSAITSSMQPARLPIALLAVLLVSGLAPLVDLADGQSFGPRGLAGGALSESEVELNDQRARSAANRIASDQVDALEAAARTDGAGASARLSRADLAAAVREATAARIADRIANGTSADDPELRRLRQRAAEALLTIEETAPRGVATTFLRDEQRAILQAAAATMALDVNALAAAVTNAVFRLPAAAIAASPLAFSLGLLVVACLIAILAGGSCRMAAVHAGRAARLSPLEGAAYARARVVNLVSLPVLPLLGLGAIALVIAIFVLALRVPVLNIVAGVLFVAPLAVALLGAILAITVVAALPLMPAAIAVEDCDAGDAITRAGALVLARPLTWIGMLALAIVALVVGGLLVNAVLGIALLGVQGLLALLGGTLGDALASGESAEIAALYGPDRIVALLVGVWTALLAACGAAYIFTLACDLGTRGYLWMREQIDGENISTVSGYGVR